MKPTTATDGWPRALYTVSIPKFVLLYLMTGGGYLFYWSYRHWVSYKQATNAPITPLMRGLFWPFFILELFEKIQCGLESKGQSCCWHPEIRGLLIMLMVMMSILVFTFFNRPLDVPFVFLVNSVLIFSSVCLFTKAQRVINLLGGDPKGRGNRGLGAANMAWMCSVALSLVLLACSVFDIGKCQA